VQPGASGERAPQPTAAESSLKLTQGLLICVVDLVARVIRIAALLAVGMTVREIAEEIGATKSAVRRMNQRIEREARKAEGGEEAGPGEGG
jgi:predicted transcriptional regulator